MTETPIEKQRREAKELTAKYRAAAIRLYPKGHFDTHSHVTMMEDGAFVSLAVWIDHKDAAKEQP